MGKGILHVPSFEGGIVLAGSSDVQSTTELKACDNLDVGTRGQLQSVASAVNFLVNRDLAVVSQPFARAYGVGGARFGNSPAMAVCVGFGKDAAGTDRYFFGQMGVEESIPAGAPVYDGPTTVLTIAGSWAPIVRAYNAVNYTQDPQVTFAQFSYVTSPTFTPANAQARLLFINLGARYPDISPREMPGLYAMIWTGAFFDYKPIAVYDSLGTGALGEFAGGTHAKQLYFRGIAAYNNHLFGFGFDDSESTTGDGASRLMFSNVGNPLKWGNDNQAAAGANRSFTDSDAITVGNGESITALCTSRGRLWIGTNKGLHYLSGYGRDSFKTDGTTGIANSLDVVGPNALCEGPDGNLYGVSSKGLWCYESGQVKLVFEKLRAFDGTSSGFWDAMQVGSPIPGSFVIDRVWLRSDKKHQQVWVVIPGVSATTGNTAGSDTIIIKYHTWSGGFTRQIIIGKVWMPGFDFSAGTTVTDHLIIPQYGDAQTTVDFGTGGPPSGQTVTFGEYMPFGPDSSGVCRVLYLTCSWPDAGALPIVFTVQPIVDGFSLGTNTVTIGNAVPAGPVNGDVWLDTSGTDTNIGNATAGVFIPATFSFVQKRWKATWSKWVYDPRGGGQLGTRATISIPFSPFPATRIKIVTTCSSTERIQIEGIAIDKGETE